MKSLADGYQPHGDQIAWKFCEQFRDTVFPSLSGARIVRIATHPSAMRVIHIYPYQSWLLDNYFLIGCFQTVSSGLSRLILSFLLFPSLDMVQLRWNF